MPFHAWLGQDPPDGTPGGSTLLPSSTDRPTGSGARGLSGTPLLAHSFERVMPGRNYVSSIRDFWRVCSGCDEPARVRVERLPD